MFFIIRAIEPTFSGPAGSTNTILICVDCCLGIKGRRKREEGRGKNIALSEFDSAID
ncbi:hypothetical protein [Okeania sp. SIO3B5]|uniref:hypothetical protein n=1 Tax=Okeania sp. SIO3B5 TaxID=2607811 RepID=UPI0025EE2EDC|nr:hypothetical protein [Okeania sp. SIO3B5]